VRRGSSLAFCFYRLKTIQIKRKKPMCCISGSAKTMTKINAEGSARGTGKISPGRRSWLILPVGIIAKDDTVLMLLPGLPGWLPGIALLCLHSDDRPCIVHSLRLHVLTTGLSRFVGSALCPLLSGSSVLGLW